MWFRVMLWFVVWAGPALAGGLTAPASVASGARTQMTPAAQAAAVKRVTGSWKIAGYRNWDED